MNSQEFYQWCAALPAFSRSTHRKPLIMAVLNVTPDSFSDGGLTLDPKSAVEKALSYIKEGADIIDIGGESSQPGATPVSSEEELKRVLPVIAELRKKSDICISIDTNKPEVMQAAVDAGASMINDINALTKPGAADMAARLQVPVCLMHMQGEPVSMQDNPQYEDIILEINQFFAQRIEACRKVGIQEHHILLDPGFGFGKTVEHNLWIVKRFNEFADHNLPLMIGASRKSTLGAILKKEVSERVFGGVAIGLITALQGVNIIRTHDVEPTQQALNVLYALDNLN
jgi:dihydropteroate synthase